MTKITKERREYLLNNLLLFMKNEIEEGGVIINNYYFEIKYPKEFYLMGVKEPQQSPASEDIIKFQKKCPFEKEELEIVAKYGIAHELLEKYTFNSFRITYSGMDKAKEYESFLEKNIADNQIILNDYCLTGDKELDKKITKSRNLFLNNDLDGAMENIWSAFERIKTILDKDKKQGSIKLCNLCATSLNVDDISNEFIVLTNIGNNYQIRHFETNKIPITDDNTKVYLYFRILSLITFAIKQMEVK